MQVIRLDEANEKYWASIPHPNKRYIMGNDNLFKEGEITH